MYSKFGKSGNAIIDDFILKKGLQWIPYNKFKEVEHLSEGGFGTIYRAIWLKNNEDNEFDKEDEEVILKCPKNLNEDLNEFLKEWEYHTSVLTSNDIINVYGLTKEPNTSKYMVVMDKKLNEILESENSQAYRASHSDLNDCLINDDRSLDKNTSKKLNESLEKFGVIGY
ncbi:unnamed protein product [Rhizophagus irregularis]|nr:unnamed protein product [Rhizophagus irregularis]